MGTSLFLTDEEVRALTDRRARKSQVIALNSMGIEHRVRPDGSVAILRAHITKIFDGGSDTHSKTKEAVPNWDAM
jgi:hypothetical protein